MNTKTTTFPTAPNQSFQSQVNVEGSWSSNSCRYAIKEEAEAAGSELLSRWFVPTGHRAGESADPVNYRFDFEAYRSEPLPAPVAAAPFIAELAHEQGVPVEELAA